MKHFLGPAMIVLTVLHVPGGIRDAISKMIPDFERKTGHVVKATFGSGGGTKQQVIRAKHSTCRSCSRL